MIAFGVFFFTQDGFLLQEITIFRRADKIRKNYQAALSHHNPSLLSDGSGNSKPLGQPEQLQRDDEHVGDKKSGTNEENKEDQEKS